MFRGKIRSLALLVLVSSLLVSSFVIPGLRADDDDASEKEKTHKEVAASAEKVLRDYYASFNKGDMKALLETVFPTLRENTKAGIQPIMDASMVTFEVLKFKLLAVDGDVAVARATIRTRGKGKQGFGDNDLESIQVFRLERGLWYNGGETVLNVKLLAMSGEKDAEKPETPEAPKAPEGEEDDDF